MLRNAPFARVSKHAGWRSGPAPANHHKPDEGPNFPPHPACLPGRHRPQGRQQDRNCIREPGQSQAPRQVAQAFSTAAAAASMAAATAWIWSSVSGPRRSLSCSAMPRLPMARTIWGALRPRPVMAAWSIRACS